MKVEETVGETVEVIVEEIVVDVRTQSGPMMIFVMMATTTLDVTLTEVLVARKIPRTDGMIGVMFVNVKRMVMTMEVSEPTSPWSKYVIPFL